MKVTVKYKEVERPIEKIILELTPKQVRFIRYLTCFHFGPAADSLFNALDCVKDVKLDWNVRFTNKETE